MAQLAHKQSFSSIRSSQSVASTSSAASSRSLTRTPRTRRRSRSSTVTGRTEQAVPNEPLPEMPAHLKGSSAASQTQIDGTLARLASLGASEDSQKKTGVTGILEDSLDTRNLPKEVLISAQSTKAGVTPTPTHPTTDVRPRKISLADRGPALADIDIARANARDSIATQDTFMSNQMSETSYYPRSSTTGTIDSIPTPPSVVSVSEPHFEPQIGESAEFDADNVASRLQLLVNNSYFLPPAHSKPRLSGFTPQPPPLVQKKSGPGFLDIFRVNKSKSKPTTPTNPQAGFDIPAPVLRTTSDSTTLGYTRDRQPQSLPHTPVPPAIPVFQDRGPRVVVVREQMTDIASAAKIAEQELHNRRDIADDESRRAIDDIIDPTDAVDLPPPSSSIFALGGSVGVQQLEERLSLNTHPDLSSLDKTDQQWRKALLHDAVSHSLYSPSISISSPILSTSPQTPFPPIIPGILSPRPSFQSDRSSRPRSVSPAIKSALQQRIISGPIADTAKLNLKSLPPLIPLLKEGSVPQRRPRTADARFAELSDPVRAETPSFSPVPLSPAPRKRPSTAQLPTRIRKRSQESVQSARVDRKAEFFKTVRKTASSPAMHDHEEERMAFMVTPPPLPVSSHQFVQDRNDVDSVYSQNRENTKDKEVETPRWPSQTLSLASDSHSIRSERSYPSPTASAFFDARSHDLDMSEHAPTSLSASRSNPSIDLLISASASPNPIRTDLEPELVSRGSSSSLTHSLLAPPFQSRSSFQSQRSTSHESISQASYLSHTSSVEILEPEPTTPPLPVSMSDRQAYMPRVPSVPRTEIRVTPAPISPPSFFDVIQSQPNALDDLDLSDESEEEDTVDEEHTGSVRGANITSSSSQSSFMRLGNHSSPHVGRPSNFDTNPVPPVPPLQRPRRTSESRKPVGFTPHRAEFFSKAKPHATRGESPLPPLSTFDYYRYAQETDPTQSTSSGGVGRARSATETGADQHGKRLAKKPSVLKLDGLLVKHMEAEKDTIRRIAETMRSANPAQSLSGQRRS